MSWKKIGVANWDHYMQHTMWILKYESITIKAK